jgi:predicted ATPase
VEAMARRQPTLLLFEDLHWVDPTTLELVDLLIDRVRQFAPLVIIAPPGVPAYWGGSTNLR